MSNAGIRVRASLDPRASARKGIVLAKRRGFYRGRKRVLSPDGLADARRRADAGDEKAQIARKLGISRETLLPNLFLSSSTRSLNPTGYTSSAHGGRRQVNGENMKSLDNHDREIRPEYDFSGAQRGRHAKAYAAGTNVVLLDQTSRRGFQTPCARCADYSRNQLALVLRRDA